MFNSTYHGAFIYGFFIQTILKHFWRVEVFRAHVSALINLLHGLHHSFPGTYRHLL
jgi:hypothetical protein